jgi:hypothetical protein
MDEYDWDYTQENVVLARPIEDDDTPLGQEEWKNYQPPAAIAELSIYNLKGVIMTGEAYNLPTTDGRVIYIDEPTARDMYQEYKEAHFDEYEYREVLQEKFDDILDRIDDALRVMLNDSATDVSDIEAWAAKWKETLDTMEDLINQTDGKKTHWKPEGCACLVNQEELDDEA